MCFDNNPMFIASNDGQGSSDSHYPLKGKTHYDVRAKEDELNAYAATLPKRLFHSLELAQSLDSLVAEAVNQALAKKQLTSLLKNKFVFTVQGKEGIFQTVRVLRSPNLPASHQAVAITEPSPEQITSFKARHKVRELLNEMTPEQALDVFISGGKLPALKHLEAIATQEDLAPTVRNGI